MRPRLLPLLLAAAALLAGCGTDRSAIRDGGRVAGENLTIYSFLPSDGPRAKTSQDLVLGEKLAFQQADGEAGDFVVNYVSWNLPQGDPGAVADQTREVVRDTGVVAVIGDLDSETARITSPLLNAAGILHLSPGVTFTAYPMAAKRSFGSLIGDPEAEADALAEAAKGKVAIESEPGVAANVLAEAIRDRVGKTVETADADTVIYTGSDPANARGTIEGILEENRGAQILLPVELGTADLARRTDPERVRALQAITPDDAAFDAAYKAAYGRDPSPAARLGYASMRSVYAAIDRAGKDAQTRSAVIDAYFQDPEPVARLGFP